MHAEAEEAPYFPRHRRRIALAVLVLSFGLPAVGVPSSADAQVNADIQPENLSIGLPKPVPRPGNPDLEYDQYGNPRQKTCPIAYFPCYQDGYFCFRPIYCKGQFSPEGSLNAMVILGGIFAPAFSLWKQKTGQEPDPNTPEGIIYWREKYKIQDKSKASKKQKTSFFSRGLEAGGEEEGK